MEKIFLIFIIIFSLTNGFKISNNLAQAGASITPEMLAKVKDICDIAYSFYGDDMVNNSKYISQALFIQGLGKNWDVMIGIPSSNSPGYSGHSNNEAEWISLKPRQVPNNNFFYYINRNSQNGGTFVNATNGNNQGTGINSSSVTIINNIIRASFQEQFKTYAQNSNYIQQRVELFFGGKWGVIITGGARFGGYVNVVEDSWCNVYYWGSFVYKMS